MAKTNSKKKTPARKPAAKSKTEAPKTRRSGPEKGISRSPVAVYERSLRDLEQQAAKLHRQADRLEEEDKAQARAIRNTAKGLDKLVDAGKKAKSKKGKKAA